MQQQTQSQYKTILTLGKDKAANLDIRRNSSERLHSHGTEEQRESLISPRIVIKLLIYSM